MTLNLRRAALVLLVPVAALATPSPDPVQDELAHQTQQARSNARSPRAVAHLLRLHALRDEVGDLQPLAQTYAELAFRRTSHPEVRRTARMLLADVERARGRLRKSQDLLRPLGYIDDFYVLGSFDNEGKSGCDVDHGPEAALDLGATYPTRERETGWRALPVAPLDGYVDLSNVIRPNKDAVAYALTFLEAKAESRTELSVGTSGAFKLWVNGEQVASETRYNQPRPDQARVAVRLRKGTNRVLLKICQESGPLGFYLRQERIGGARASVVDPLPTTLPEIPKGPPLQPQRVPTVTTLLEREIARAPNDAEVRGAYATVLDAFRAFDEREHTAVNVAQAVADAKPQNARLQLLAAELHVEDHNLRRKYLARALAADPKLSRARLALAQLELERGHPERALEDADEVLARHPRYVGAQLLRAQALAALEEWPTSVQQVEHAFRSAPQVPIAVREAARTSRRMDRTSEAIVRYRAAVGLRFDDDDSRRALAGALADLGRPEQSAHELEALLKLSPFDNATRLRLAELWASNGKIEEALERFEEARALSPDEPDVPERMGRALMHAGLREKALAAFERSLALRPQNPALREAVRALQGLDAAYGVQYAQDVTALAKEADAYAGEDAVSLVELAYTRVAASGQSSRFHQFAVKVFTQRGADAYRSFPITYSPNRQEVQVLKVRITRPDGAVVESFGETDRAINEPWSGMYYDARARELSFPGLSPGDVLEVQYRLEDTARENLLSDYWGDVDYVQSVMPRLRYRYLVDMPSSRPLYWNKSQLPPGVKTEQSTPEEGRVLYSWSAERVAKIVPEPSMPGWAEVATTLHVSTYKTWDDVGRYWWGLVRDQLTPNEELRRTVDQALVGVDRTDDLAVVRAIYNFVVTNTRYVALEFGIHGYKPYRVDRVLARRFGDCKDKASLIHAMLKIANVDSRLVLLRMRDLGTLTGEPASLAAFNHAIVYVPKHELYLDGTAAFHGATELPTADRVANVLIVEPDGQSRFLTTPESKPGDNLTHLEMDVTLGPDGSAKVEGRSQVTGVQAPEYRRSYQAAATRRADFERGWAQTFPGLTVGKVTLNDVARLDEPVQLTFDLAIPRYSEVLPTGLRFFPFGSGRAYAQTYAPLVERTHDLVMGHPWSNSFTFRYTLPPGHSVGDLPPEVNETSEFGSLRMSWRVEDGKLVCEGLIELGASRVSAKSYPAFRAFLARVDQAFSRKLLVKKTSGGQTVQAPPSPRPSNGT